VNNFQNITFIGMPGSGKSIYGKKLAKMLQYSFLDIDKLVEKQTGIKLQQIIDKFGDKKLMEVEENATLNLGFIRHYVISPGGSIIYSLKAMEFLKKISKIIFLDAPYEVIKKRLSNPDKRGIVGLKVKGLKEIYQERLPFYRKYANITLQSSDDLNINALMKSLEK